MNILVATSAPSFWQPQAQCMAQAIRDRGHEASVATPQSIDRLADRSCDVLVCIGSGETLKRFLDTIPAAGRILYLVESVPTPSEADDFTRFKLSVHQHYLGDFDHVFVHTRRSIPQLVALGVQSVEALVWPHFPSIFHPLPQVEKDLDVLFVGTPSEHRKRILELAASKFHVTHGPNVFHGNSTALYARAKIALNIHFTPLANFECRVIEALGCGALLFTEALDPGDLLVDGEHLVVFKEENLLALLDRYLRDQHERERIASAGHQAVQRFSLGNQVERILEVAAGLRSARTVARKEIATPSPSKSAATELPANQVNVTINDKTYAIQFPRSHSIDYMVQELYVKQIYPFLQFLPMDPGIILDVGANIGCSSILFRALYPTATVFAFEPDPETFAFLQINAASLGQTHVFDYGLYNRDTSAMLFQGQGTSTTNSISPSVHNTAQCHQIKLRRISSVIAELGIGQISLLKIDTEGAEIPILEDAEPFLDRVGAVFLEYHSEADRLEIDRMLSGRFALCHANVSLVHRGALAYVAKHIIAGQTNMDRLEIARPRI